MPEVLKSRFPSADVSGIKRKMLNLAYAPQSAQQKLDLYLPEEGEGPFPVLIHFHGGGFLVGDKRDVRVLPFLEALKRGYAVASVEYRKNEKPLLPAPFLDAREAVRFLKAHADEYGLAPERVAAVGDSAGGSISAMLAMNIPNGEIPGEEGRMFAQTPYVRCSVIHFAPFDIYPPAFAITDRMAPVLVRQGTADELVNVKQALDFVSRVYDTLGKQEISLEILDGAVHEDPRFTDKRSMERMFGFLDTYIGKTAPAFDEEKT